MTHVQESLITNVAEVTGSTGSVTITGLNAAKPYYLPTVTPGNTVFYSILADAAGNWEYGFATWTANGNGTTTFGTFARTSPIRSRAGLSTPATFSGNPVSLIFGVPAEFDIFTLPDGTIVNGGRIVKAVNVVSFADLVAQTVPPDTDVIYRVGYGRAAGDGLGGFFQWKAGNTDAADDHTTAVTVNTIAPAIGTGRYKRLFEVFVPQEVGADSDIPSGGLARNATTKHLRTQHPTRGGVQVPEVYNAFQGVFQSYAEFKALASTQWINGDRFIFLGILTQGDCLPHEMVWDASSTNTDALDSLFLRPDDISGSNAGRASRSEPGAVLKFNDGDATPSVKASQFFRISDAGTPITAFDDAIDLLAYTVLPHPTQDGSLTHSAALICPGGNDFQILSEANGGSPVIVVYEQGVGRVVSGGAETVDGFVDAGKNAVLPSNADNAAALEALINTGAPNETIRLRRGVTEVSASLAPTQPVKLSGADRGVVLQRDAEGVAGNHYLFNATSAGLNVERLALKIEQDPLPGSAFYFIANVGGDNAYEFVDTLLDGGMTWQPDDSRDSYGGAFIISGNTSGIVMDRADLQNLVYVILKSNTSTAQNTDTRLLFNKIKDVDVAPLLFNSPAEGGFFKRGLVIGNDVSDVRQASESLRHGGSVAGYVSEFIIGFNHFHGQIGDWFRTEPPASDNLFIGNMHEPSEGDGGYELNAGLPAGTGTAADGVPVHSERMVWAFNATKNAVENVERSGVAWRARNTSEYIQSLKASILTSYIAQDYAAGYEFGPGQETVFVDRAMIIRGSIGLTDYFPSLSKDEFIFVDTSEIILRRSGVLGRVRMRSIADPPVPQAILLRTADPSTAYAGTYQPAANLDGYAGITGFDYETGEIDLPAGSSQYDLVTGKDMRIDGVIEAVMSRVEGQEGWGRWRIFYDGTTFELTPQNGSGPIINVGSTQLSGSPLIISDADGSGRRTLQLQTFSALGSAAANTRLQVKFSGFIGVKD